MKVTRLAVAVSAAWFGMFAFGCVPEVITTEEPDVSVNPLDDPAGGSAAVSPAPDPSPPAVDVDVRMTPRSVEELPVVEPPVAPMPAVPVVPPPAAKPQCLHSIYSSDYYRQSLTSTVVDSVSLANAQDILSGAASDGGSMLVLHGCGSDGHVWLYDGQFGGSYSGTDVTSALAGVDLGEGRFSLAPDGVTVISARLDGPGLALRRRPSRQTTVFTTVDNGELGTLNEWAVGRQLSFPVLSPDGLSLFFLGQTLPLSSDSDANGLYEATRASLALPFGLPTRLGGPLGDPELGPVTGVSTDRLTVFAGNWTVGTSVFVRARLGDEWVRQEGDPIPAARVLPVGADCSTLLGVRTPGGCGGEELVTLVADTQRDPRPFVSPLSRTVDHVGQNDGDLSPDDYPDGVFEVPVQGPISALILVGVTATGTPLPQHWDTLIGAQPIPDGVSFFDQPGGTTPGIGVEEDGSLLNLSDGSLPVLSAGRHRLTLYVHDSTAFVPGSHFRVFGIRPDGLVVNGPIIEYPGAEPTPVDVATPPLPHPAPRCGHGIYSSDIYRQSLTSSVIEQISLLNAQDILAGAANDGASLLVRRGCYSYGGVWLHDGPLGGPYSSADVTSALAGLSLIEGRFTLAPDGLTVISTRFGEPGLALRRRDSRQTTVFGEVDTTELTTINEWAVGRELFLPVLSPDGLSLFLGQVSELEPPGLYEATRASTQMPFDIPQRLSGPLGDAQLGSITGVSPDRLTIFAGDYSVGTNVFVRASVGAELVRQTTDPLPAWNVVPVGTDCGVLLGVRSPGGCAAEEIVTLVADARPVALPLVSPLTRLVDYIGQADGDFGRDYYPEGAFEVPVEGPLSALILTGVTATGTPLPLQWDTLVGNQPIPDGISFFEAPGSATMGLAVAENGYFLNLPDGSLPALSAGRHWLTVFASDSTSFAPGNHFRVYGVRPDGLVVNGPIFAY